MVEHSLCLLFTAVILGSTCFELSVTLFVHVRTKQHVPWHQHGTDGKARKSSSHNTLVTRSTMVTWRRVFTTETPTCRSSCPWNMRVDALHTWEFATQAEVVNEEETKLHTSVLGCQKCLGHSTECDGVSEHCRCIRQGGCGHVLSSRPHRREPVSHVCQCGWTVWSHGQLHPTNSLCSAVRRLGAPSGTWWLMHEADPLQVTDLGRLCPTTLILSVHP